MVGSRVGLLLLIASLGACSMWAPGDDPKGREMRRTADQLLVALEAFQSRNGRLPSDLEELVPTYVGTIPQEPQFSLNNQGALIYSYTPSWPAMGRISCGARVGSREWKCAGYV